MKHYKTILTAAIFMFLICLAACSGPRYKDGVYTAQLSEFPSNGWKDIVEITIEGGRLTDVDWDAIYKDDSIPIRKKQYSKCGLYGMLLNNSIGEWYDHSTAAAKFVLENGVGALNVSEEGYSDAVSGCTIHVNGFDMLLRECLEQARR